MAGKKAGGCLALREKKTVGEANVTPTNRRRALYGFKVIRCNKKKKDLGS